MLREILFLRQIPSWRNLIKSYFLQLYSNYKILHYCLIPIYTLEFLIYILLKYNYYYYSIKTLWVWLYYLFFKIYFHIRLFSLVLKMKIWTLPKPKPIFLSLTTNPHCWQNSVAHIFNKQLIIATISPDWRWSLQCPAIWPVTIKNNSGICLWRNATYRWLGTPLSRLALALVRLEYPTEE